MLSYPMRRICNTNQQMKLKNGMGKDMGPVYYLCWFSGTPKHRQRKKDYNRFNAKDLKKIKIK